MSEQLEMEVGQPEITVAQLDEQVERYAMLKNKYTILKQEATDAQHLMDAQAERLLLMMEQCGKKSYKVDGLGTISRKEAFSVPTPKTTDNKKAFFKWVEGEYGTDGMWAYTSVQSQTLNRLYNDCRNAAEEQGKEFTMDGIDLPTTRVSLSFRKS